MTQKTANLSSVSRLSKTIWDPHDLTTLQASMACYGDSLYFSFLSLSVEYKQQQLDNICCLHPLGSGDRSSSKILITTTNCHNTQDHNLKIHHCENLTSHGDTHTPCRNAEYQVKYLCLQFILQEFSRDNLSFFNFK
jgi:hypothetical protein